MLESLGYSVEKKLSPYDALEAFRENPEKFDAVITDMTMPGMNGEELSKEIKKIRKDIPIILCTGYNSNVNPETGKEVSVSRIIMKPLTLHELAKTVRKVLDESKSYQP